MIRYVVVLCRRSGSTREEFHQAWAEHGELVRRLPGVLAVTLNPAVEGSSVQRDDFDGIGFLDFPDVPTMEACLASPQARAVREHTATFADAQRAQRFVVQVGPTLTSSYDG